jgi:hypothetical protein
MREYFSPPALSASDRFARDTEGTEGFQFFSYREAAIGEKYAIDFPLSPGKSNE